MAEEYSRLDDIDGADLHISLRTILDDLSVSHSRDDEGQSVLHVSQLGTDPRACWGVIQAGEYGFAAEGIDARTFRQTYQRQPTDAEMLPFYFYVEVPEDKSSALLLVQRFGSLGVYSALREALRSRLREMHDGFVVEFARLVPAGLIQEYLSGDLTKIQIRWLEVPNDVADRYGIGANQRREVEYHVTFQARRGGWIEEPSWLTAWRNRDGTLVELPEEYDDVGRTIRVEFQSDGTQRTMNPEQLGAMLPYHDVTDEVDIADSGHPTFESIHRAAQRLAAELRQDMGN